MILDNILAACIGFAIVLMLYLVITHCVNEYRWRKLKGHVIEAIEALDLWDAVITHPCLTQDMFHAITTFLDEHNYRHCFYEHGGAFWLMTMLVGIRIEHERS